MWATQAQTFERELLGSGTGEPDAVAFVTHTPVLAGEIIEVRELEGPRADVEEPMLREELRRARVSEDDVHTTPRDSRTSEIWVRWRPRSHLLFSDPGERVYALERTRGRVVFGDERRGRVAPPGRDNIRLLSYRAGGGTAGNVLSGAVSQVLSGVVVESVTNPHSAEGGSESEAIDDFRLRGGSTIRHRRQAVSLRDYEALALEATSAVAVARALPARHPTGREAPGWVTVRIVPQSAESVPIASFELREQVRRFLADRAPAAVAARIAVIPAEYFLVGAEAVVRSILLKSGGAVRQAVEHALAVFLDPLRGGPNGRGWPFGRAVCLSDVAHALRALPGVDYIPTLTLLRNGTPVGDVLEVPQDRLVAAADIRVTLAGRE